MPWVNAGQLDSKKFRCGFCGNIVATDRGYFSNSSHHKICICPHCDKPTFFDLYMNQIPGVVVGNDVASLPNELMSIYNEARECVSINAFTASVLACRKLLMHVAVEQGAEQGKSFISYVQFLADKGYVPPNGKAWVDHIRSKGNEATHEIVLMKRTDAEELISFSEMLLKFIYEFPAKVPSKEA